MNLASAMLVFLALATTAIAQTAANVPPGTHRVYTDIELSRGVAIDDPDRLIHYIEDGPQILERAKDPEPWIGDAKVWTEGEFVENEFPKIYPPGTPGVNVACSKHVRIIYGNHKLMTEEYVRGNLRMFEECLKLFYLKLGYPVPFESRDPKKRDGKKHKVDVLVGASNLPPHNGKPQYTGGGAFGGFDSERSFGFLYVGPDYMRHTPPSGATPHELGHSVQNHCNTHSKGSGFWWEAHANWMMLQFINTYPHASNVVNGAEFYWGHGRHYYDSWHIFEHLKDEPGFGHEFVRKVWTDGGAAEDMEYIWSKAERFAAQMSPPRSMSDEWGKMARRNVTWDYRRGDIFKKQDKGAAHWRDGRVLLEPIAHQPGWWRVPAAMAPQQFGYNICPLEATAREVAVDFQGYANAERGADWRASLVAVNAVGKPRYSAMWNRGVQSFALAADEKELYLVVSATPRVMELVPETDYRGAEKERFHYAVKLDGARPLNLLAQRSEPRDKDGNPVAGKPHANGGGFVADTARVEPTAFVGPNAKVLGKAKLLGQARLEDFAIVQDTAVLKDRAVVSGHALIEDGARVEGEARLTDFARLHDNAVAGGRARLIEHAAARDNCRVSDLAVLKGRAHSWSERVFGTAMLDGDYANSLNVGRNVWFHWFVNTQEKADAADDLRGLYAQYTFEKSHPYLARDTHGATRAFLLGAPEIRRDASFGGIEEVADRVETIARLDQRNVGGRDWGALIRGFLHPPAGGEFNFHLASDNQAELWLSTDETAKNKKKIAGGPGKTGPPVKLSAGKPYYFEILHKQGDGADELKLEWESATVPRAAISGDALSIEPRGERGKARRLVWTGIPGNEVKELTASAKFKPDATRPRLKSHLLLNGRNQALELPRDIAFQAELGIELTLRRNAGNAAQCVFEFISLDAKNRLALLLDAAGQPRVVVRRDGKETLLVAPYKLPAGQWIKVGVSLGDGGTALLLNGKVAAENPQLMVAPWTMNLRAGYLGRSLAGEFFNGAFTDVSFYAVPLLDRAAPRPNPAVFELPPTPLSSTTITMRAVAGEEARGVIEYRFADVGRAFDSGWVKSPQFTAPPLQPGRALQVITMMRDAAGNTGKPSEPVKLAMPAKDGPAFQFEGGRCVIEAEHSHAKIDTAQSKWKPVKRDTYSGGEAIEIPDTGHTADAVAAASGQAPRLDYRVAFPKPGKYHLTVRAFANHNGNNTFFAGADFPSAPARLELKTAAIRWSEAIELEIATPGVHLVHLWMAKDGVHFDAILLSSDSKNLPVGDAPAGPESAQR